VRVSRARVFATVWKFLGDFLATLRSVSFGPFTLDAGARQLVRGARREVVHLSPKAYELLALLLETRPQALSKAEIHERLWPSTYVSDATLASVVADLREALDTPEGRAAGFIRTVHGYGYAFAGDAHELGVVAAATPRIWMVCNGREVAVPEGEHLIGRDPASILPLDSPTVSRRHARLVCDADTATLEDLGSKNGTIVRGTRITSVARLADGDRIRIGAFELTFRMMNAAGSTETAG
jgi:DNA-binding winged helix-turn-helix (wHTH) protein